MPSLNTVAWMHGVHYSTVPWLLLPIHWATASVEIWHQLRVPQRRRALWGPMEPSDQSPLLFGASGRGHKFRPEDSVQIAVTLGSGEGSQGQGRDGELARPRAPVQIIPAPFLCPVHAHETHAQTYGCAHGRMCTRIWERGWIACAKRVHTCMHADHRHKHATTPAVWDPSRHLRTFGEEPKDNEKPDAHTSTQTLLTLKPHSDPQTYMKDTMETP